MSVSLIRQIGRELTAPNPVRDFLLTQMNSVGGGRDPVQRAGRALAAGRFSIDNNGGAWSVHDEGLLCSPYNSIDGKDEQRLENGGCTDVEERLYGCFYHTSSIAELAQQVIEANYKEYDAVITLQARNDDYYKDNQLYAAGQTAIGSDGRAYTTIYERDENGNPTTTVAYVDNGNECSFKNITPDGTVDLSQKPIDPVESLTMMKDDPNFWETHEAKADGSIVPKSVASIAIDKTIAEQANRYTENSLYALGLADTVIADVSKPAANAPKFASTGGAAVNTDVKVRPDFEAAATADAPKPVTSLVGFRKPTLAEELKAGKVADAGLPAANADIYALSAPVPKP